jgi:hypothetical protein
MRLLLLSVLSLWALSSHAGLLVSNIGQSVGSTSGVRFEEWSGSPFLAADDATLSSITIDLIDATAANGGFFLSLWSDVSGEPGLRLLTLNGNTDPNTAGTYSYTGDYALDSGTTYWVIAGIDADNSSWYHWTWTNSTAEDSGSLTGWDIPDQYNSSPDQGATWPNGFSGPQRFTVNGDVAAVPVPGTAALPLIGVAGLRLYRQSRSVVAHA